MKPPVVHQSTETDCGAACVVMIARHFGIAVGLPEIRAVLGTGSAGSSLRGIAVISRWIGLRTSAFQLNLNELDELDELPLPAILAYRDHFVVLFRADRKSAWIIDPSLGSIRISRTKLAQDWLGACLTFAPIPGYRIPQGINRLKPSLIENKVLPRQGGRFWVSIFLISTVVNGAVLVAPLISKQVMDQLGNLQATGALLKFSLATLGLLLLSLLLNALRRIIIQRTLNRVYLERAAHFFRKILNSPFAFLAGFSGTDLLNRVQNAETVIYFFISRLTEALLDLILCLCSIGLAMVYSPWIGLSVALTLGATIAFSLFLAGNMALRESQIQKARARSMINYLDGTSNIPLIKSLSLADFFLDRWLDRHREYQSLRSQQETELMANQLFTQLVARGLPTIALLGGVALILRQKLSLGDLFALLGFVSLACGTALNLTSFLAEFKRMEVNRDQVQEILDAPSEASPIKMSYPAKLIASHDLLNLSTSIDFSKVGFRYPGIGSPWIFKDLSLKIGANETVAVMGPSGTGKTSFLSMLLRLYPISRGSFELGGVPVESIPLKDFRSLFSVAEQEGNLILGTVEENIAVGIKNIDLAHVAWALQMAEAEEFVAALPDGQNTKIYTPTGNFSKGQRQRLILARAIYARRKILLLDEATSQLDRATEEKILKNLETLRGKMSIVFVTHRQDVAQWCGRTVYLRDGIAQSTASIRL